VAAACCKEITVTNPAGVASGQERERLQRHLDAVDAIIVCLDTDGRMTMVNRVAARWLGADERGIIGCNWFETCLVPTANAPGAIDLFRRLVAGDLGGQATHEERVVRCDGEERVVAWHSAALKDADGRVTGILCTGNDVTARRGDAQAFAAEVARRQALLDHSRDGILIIDQDHRVIEANQRFAEMVGWSPDEVLGLRTWDFEALMSEADVRAGFADLSTTNVTFESVHVRKDGSTYPVEVSATGAVWGGQNLVLCVCRDITDRKRAEAEHARLQAQLLQSQKIESVGRLAGGVAHDFNNTLQAMLGNVELALEDAPTGSDLRDCLLEIRRAGGRAAELTRQLLTFARMQAVTPRVVDLNDTVAGLLDMLRQVTRPEIDLAWEPGVGVWPIRIDPTQVGRVVTDLVANAADAIAATGRITLTTANARVEGGGDASRGERPSGDYVRLSVSDSGSGMTPEALEHVFEPFFTTKPVGQGTGLGLATVYGIVRQNGGFIDVTSAAGAGSQFVIWLPRFVGEA